MKNLKDKVIIITGGAAGIGGAMTTELTERGSCIVAVDLNEEAGKEKVASNPKQIAFIKGDISKESVAKEAVSLAISKFGKLTSVVNNAHASRQKPIMELTDEDWELSMNTGLKGTLNFMKAAYPELKKTKGSIVNFGSGAGLLGQKNQGSYAAAKEAIRGLSRVVANEWAEDGIRVNVVCPLAFTEGVKQWKEHFPEQYEEIISKNPLGRFGDPQKDVAPIVAFLLSDDSQYMTGQTLMADGGDIKLR
ncbi:NAD(P)-dependent dehydrogenase (short-subunit alcohol dehydrogenase family) [Winogradskyella epiphytica]|uniref:NAD(P)-dependent dehydrogenase (Short-subunit alcohol dehydrogenase family) n=1 Tax=Winogradskyella epiphytica TaxID=262005 RepID=A0A2V4XHH8_9FLAO|nr:SDR family oxidoreductase [Winogradskyella epiphytica]PYE82740.1 NAD(P)-dependent dehydrogenase (short-subunit alcohol dehydrogenase family) [Winogradskyella epiphytica]GGW53293.1 short-chain dehydrogenase [Winogradskyella epiphytica]